MGSFAKPEINLMLFLEVVTGGAEGGGGGGVIATGDEYNIHFEIVLIDCTPLFASIYHSWYLTLIILG